MTVVSPNNATLTCVADGVPVPTMTWLREVEGITVEVPPMVQTVLMVTQTQVDRTTMSTISFFFTQPPFASNYTCRASNLLGSIDQAAVLTVQGKIV